MGEAPDKCREAKEQGECDEVDAGPGNNDDHQRDNEIENDFVPLIT